nr:PEP-CTERM sorting domain-containing protein [Gammaproteobacteria bacterium]
STGGWSEFNYTGNPAYLNASGKPDGVIDPGNGGQAFDTEYLFYKYDANLNNLSIGLQTGFDVVDGKVRYGNGTVYDDNSSSGKAYYAGDLALSFDGNVIIGDSSGENHNTNPDPYGNSYEYAVDFGLMTKDIDGNLVYSTNHSTTAGIDNPGLYKVKYWDNDIWYSSSSPFAMDYSPDDGQVTGLISNDSGSGLVDRTSHTGQNLSYYRIVSFNLDNIIAEGETFTVDSHWTMSCGNDAINGNIQLTRNSGGGNPVPEPSALALFAIGSLGMGFMGVRRKKPVA